MADSNDIKQKALIANLCNALMYKKYKKVRQHCRDLPEGPLQRIGIYNDTVLHMVAHTKQKDLVLDLLNMLPADPNHQLSDIKNGDGNTILHEAATSNAMIRVAEELLRRDENFLFACNVLGEKPIFCAARYGQTKMFLFLAWEMKLSQQSPEDSKAHLQRNDGTTVLHISIASECFDLAFLIVDRYPFLIEARDQASMIALQYLACKPTPFNMRRVQTKRGFIEELSKSRIERMTRWMFSSFDEKWLPPCITEDKRYALKKLVKLLVKKDTSWDASINSQAVGLGESQKEPEMKECSSELSEKKAGQNSQESSISKYKKSDESPLFLATMSNIKEIVKEILICHPQAFNHTNKEGMNILQVAIIYRHTDIFNMVVKFEMFARRLLSATDNEGNSVLHMVSQKRKSQASEKMHSPAFQLRNELLLFEKVKSASKMLVSNPLNKKNQTAEELFAATNEKLHKDAKEWLMRTTENCTILSVFIATVAFAAAYTVPGGPDDKTGIPILKSKPLFVVFIIADVISITLALTSVGMFLSILTSSFPLEDFETYLFKKLTQGIICLVLSVSMMAVAFGATIVLIMTENGKNVVWDVVALIMTENGKNVVWDVVAFLPVPIFLLSYSPLRSAVLGPCGEWFIVFVVFFLLVVVNLVEMFLFVLFALLFGAFFGPLWSVKKACEFIVCKPIRWICGNKSQLKSDTQSQV